MDETAARGFALAHVTRTLLIVYRTFDRLGELYQPTATRLTDCHAQLTAGLCDLADVGGARELALMMEIRSGGR